MQENGYNVTLIGTAHFGSKPLTKQKFTQKRLFCIFKKGFLFYAEYNFRLFIYLLFRKSTIICCIDLDTMLPVWLIGKLSNRILVYDAHEYFTQQKEIVSRPFIYRFWYWIERNFMPSFTHGYTVSQSIADEFKNLYGLDYSVIRNIPFTEEILLSKNRTANNRILLYQGAVNEARGLEYLIPAMKHINATLHIYGTGNFISQTEALIKVNHLEHKIILKGNVLPSALKNITKEAYIGVNLVENTGKNQYYSLANKFFDYIHAGIPQISMDFPEYRKINNEFEIATLLKELHEHSIVEAINELLLNESKYNLLQLNCRIAAQQLNWQNEEKKLIQFYKNIE